MGVVLHSRSRPRAAGRSAPAGRGRLLSRVAVGAVGAGAPAALSAHLGGYLPSAWGPIGAIAAAIALVATIAGRPAGIRPVEIAWLACFAALGTWQIASVAWTTGDGAAVRDGELTLTYGLCAAALVCLVRRSEVEDLVLGLAVGILGVSLWGLGRHLLPGWLSDEATRLESPRLAGPMGYANAAGLLAAIGLVLAVAVLTHRGRWLRAAAGGAAVVFSATLYLTLSRGAIVAAAVGIAGLIACDRRRRDIAVSGVVAAGLAAIVVALGARLPAVTGQAEYSAMRADGHRLVLELLPLVAVGALVGLLRGLVPIVPPVPRRVARPAGVVGAVALVACLAILISQAGGPSSLLHRATSSFQSSQTVEQGVDSSRLLSASGTVRSQYWSVAREMIAREPLLGEGAGSYERWWTQLRPEESGVRNAHSLYLEMLAETGPIALLLVVAILLVPMIRLPRVRDVPLAPAAVAGLMAFAAQSALDWGWEIPVLVLPALALAAVPLVAARADRGVEPLSAATRAVVALAGVAAIALCLGMYVGNAAAVRSAAAYDGDRLGRAVAEARRAERWQPWSAEPYLLLGEAELARGRVELARPALREAVRRDPESWEAWLALALVTDGRERDAAVSRALVLDPLGSEVRALGGL